VFTLLLSLALAECGDPPPPPLEVVRGLPSAAAVKEQIESAERFLENYHADWPGRWAPGGVHWNLWYWRRLETAQDTKLTALERRRAVGELVEWLGWEAVLTGRIPPAVPLHLIPVAR
jgi:hypothetical protein